MQSLAKRSYVSLLVYVRRRVNGYITFNPCNTKHHFESVHSVVGYQQSCLCQRRWLYPMECHFLYLSHAVHHSHTHFKDNLHILHICTSRKTNLFRDLSRSCNTYLLSWCWTIRFIAALPTYFSLYRYLKGLKVVLKFYMLLFLHNIHNTPKQGDGIGVRDDEAHIGDRKCISFYMIGRACHAPCLLLSIFSSVTVTPELHIHFLLSIIVTTILANTHSYFKSLKPKYIQTDSISNLAFV